MKVPLYSSEPLPPSLKFVLHRLQEDGYLLRILENQPLNCTVIFIPNTPHPVLNTPPYIKPKAEFLPYQD